eukprot:scaffold2825_cov145-Chaetoceros_neogracile.AAC.3
MARDTKNSSMPNIFTLLQNKEEEEELDVVLASTNINAAAAGTVHVADHDDVAAAQQGLTDKSGKSWDKINSIDNDGYTALHTACRFGASWEVIKGLLGKLDEKVINAIDNGGRSALHTACMYKASWEVVNGLLGKLNEKAINAIEKNGRTALHTAFENNASWEVTNGLLGELDEKVINAIDNGGRSALHYACWHGASWEVINGLLGKLDEEVINAIDNIGGTALHNACDNGASWEVIKGLLGKLDEKVINAIDNGGRSALHIACKRGASSEVINSLLGKLDEEAINAIDIHGYTALHYDTATDPPDDTATDPDPGGDDVQRGQPLKSDTEKGEDQLELTVYARILAEYIASSDLDTPFVLGILGKWGSGKSFFFNLVMEHLYEIQKKKVQNPDTSQYVGHMYYVKFDAWTYSKKDLWSSLMYRIFKDLSEQLDLEAKLSEAVDLTEGDFSVMELFQRLSKAEQGYFSVLKGKDISEDTLEKLRDCRRHGERVSKPMSNVFSSSMDKDNADLKEAEINLKNMKNENIWNMLRRDKTNMNILNRFERTVLSEINKAIDSDKRTEMMRKTLDENIEAFHQCKKLWMYVSSKPLTNILLVLFIGSICIGAYFVWSEYGEEWGLSKSIIFIVAGAPSFLASFYQYQEHLKMAAGFSKKFLAAQETIPDIEAAITNSARREIKKEQKKIEEIKKRLIVLEGESMHSVVKDRVDSDVYTSHLGIVHQAKEDLDRLGEAMHNKYLEERYSANFAPPDILSSNTQIWKISSTQSKQALKWKDKKISIFVYKHESRSIVVGISSDENLCFVTQPDRQAQSDWNLRHIRLDYECREVIFLSNEKNKRGITLSFHDLREPSGTNIEDTFRAIMEKYALTPNQNELLSCCSSIFTKKLRNRRTWTPTIEDEGPTPMMFPRGKPRIILFIDDLDRCEPENVIDVLEAMQLLVKTDLFVVVAAIDPRYVCLSLETRKYKHILNSFKCPTGMDFLEKIIQIPFRLPSIDGDKMVYFVAKQIVEDEPTGSIKEDEPTGSIKEDATKSTFFHEEPKHKREEEQSMQMQKFSSTEADSLKEACKAFQLSPRSVKRVINVFKIMKLIWHRKGEDEKVGIDALKEHSLLLLVMCASEGMRLGMYKLFNLMEARQFPIGNDKNLQALIITLCETSEDENKIFAALNEHKFENIEDWIKISERFVLARSFSFFRAEDGNKVEMQEDPIDGHTASHT